MCCLKYEHPLYQEFAETGAGDRRAVETPDGDGTVVGHNVPGEKVVVRMAADGRVSRCALAVGVLVPQGLRLALTPSCDPCVLIIVSQGCVVPHLPAADERAVPRAPDAMVLQRRVPARVRRRRLHDVRPRHERAPLAAPPHLTGWSKPLAAPETSASSTLLHDGRPTAA